MAAEKKASEKKAAKKSASGDKKVAKTKAKTTKSPKSKKLGSASEIVLTLSVPQGGQIIRVFNLMPSLPVAGQAGNWLLYDPNDPGKQDISNVIVSFSGQSTPTQREFERAVFVINIVQNPNESQGQWRFALGGVAPDNPNIDPNQDVSVEITNGGYTLISYVHVYEDSIENITFGYVASFTNLTSGAVDIYESSDPGIIPKRP
jgi:hypothetical protein